MAATGKMRYITKEFNFEWQIEDYFSHISSCRSPSFSFAGELWHLRIYPSGQSNLNSQECVCLYLSRETSGPPINLAWFWGLKTFDGKIDHEDQFKRVFVNTMPQGTIRFVNRYTLQEKKSELVPYDVLTIVFTVECCSKSNDGASYTVTATCPYCKKESASSHEHKCLDKPIRCPTCSDVVALREWFDHECEIARIKANEKLVNELANIIENDEHSDVTIRMKDKDFRLHRSILATRNPYFSSMFKTEMIEKNTGVVTIDDCEPDIFHSFIYFVYTGKMHTLSCDNVCALYEVADKYQEDQLKAECLSFMKNKISIDSFCDFVVLALKHDEKELLENATDLFCKKTKEIIQGIQWQTFVREFPTQANELYIKVLDYYDANGCMKCRTNST